MATRHNRLTVTINGNDTVTLRMQRRPAGWGPIDTFQFTLTRRTFERALADADMTVPWQELSR